MLHVLERFGKLPLLENVDKPENDLSLQAMIYKATALGQLAILSISEDGKYSCKSDKQWEESMACFRNCHLGCSTLKVHLRTKCMVTYIQAQILESHGDIMVSNIETKEKGMGFYKEAMDLYKITWEMDPDEKYEDDIMHIQAKLEGMIVEQKLNPNP